MSKTTDAAHETPHQPAPEDLEVETWEEPLQATALVLRNPVPSGPSSFDGELAQIQRHDGGWLATNPETGERYWVPDANVVCARLVDSAAR